jgi:hypothetical protein
MLEDFYHTGLNPRTRVPEASMLITRPPKPSSTGFTQQNDKICPIPACILCNEVLQNNSMAPAKLNLHFEAKHSEHKVTSKVCLQKLSKYIGTKKFKSEKMKCTSAFHEIKLLH